jgi:hypothetical protein
LGCVLVDSLCVVIGYVYVCWKMKKSMTLCKHVYLYIYITCQNLRARRMPRDSCLGRRGTRFPRVHMSQDVYRYVPT